ncbi:MAG: DUF4249 domain-containing protein [Flavobacteriia bacterium]|nr:DUF4249 domain-containing protein [Flavobacteriia bacterium]
MNKFIAVIIILGSFQFSCKKEIKYKGDPEGAFIVVNGLIEADSIIQISLSKSKPAIGEQNTGPSEITSDANLSIVDQMTGEVFTSNQISSSGYYLFNTTAKVGHQYNISVDYSNFKTCTSSTKIPISIPINSWDTLTFQENNSYKKTLKIVLNDPSGKNYYALKLFSIDTVTNSQDAVYLSVTENTNLNYDGGSILTFDDHGFDGTTKTMNFSFYPIKYFDTVNGSYNIEKSYRLELYHLTEETYNYVVSTWKAAMNNDNFFGEPVKVFTNIKNGLGIFGGMNKSVIYIQ